MYMMYVEVYAWHSTCVEDTGQLCGVILSFHPSMGHRDQTQVIKLVWLDHKHSSKMFASEQLLVCLLAKVT